MPSRGKLATKENRSIERKLPRLSRLVETVSTLSPDFISMGFKPNSTIPVASVCLRDATDVLCDVKYALFEAYAHKRWYEKDQPKESNWVGIHFARFYADDACLRLFSAGEHLAAAIINMYELSKRDLRKHNGHGRGVSMLSRVSSYMIAEEPPNPLTRSLEELVTSKAWQSAVDYRNEWVHTQPPLIAGVGIVYKRRNRWITSDGGVSLTFGGGDKPDILVNDLLEFVGRSTMLFSKASRATVRSYVRMLSLGRMKVTHDKLSVRL